MILLKRKKEIICINAYINAINALYIEFYKLKFKINNWNVYGCFIFGIWNFLHKNRIFLLNDKSLFIYIMKRNLEKAKSMNLEKAWGSWKVTHRQLQYQLHCSHK